MISKHRVTIPKTIRRVLDLQEGDIVDVIINKAIPIEPTLQAVEVPAIE